MYIYTYTKQIEVMQCSTGLISCHFLFNLGILRQQSGGCVLVLHCITYTFSAHILVLNLFGVWGTGPVGIPKGLVPNPCVRLLPLSLFSYTYYLCTSNTVIHYWFFLVIRVINLHFPIICTELTYYITTIHYIHI